MLLDKVAEAIWNAQAAHEGGNTGWADADADVRERFTGYACAALRALATPTPHMLREGNRALQTWEHSEHYRSPIDGIYHAMITAELPEQKQTRRTDSFDEA